MGVFGRWRGRDIGCRWRIGWGRRGRNRISDRGVARRIEPQRQQRLSIGLARCGEAPAGLEARQGVASAVAPGAVGRPGVIARIPQAELQIPDRCRALLIGGSRGRSIRAGREW